MALLDIGDPVDVDALFTLADDVHKHHAGHLGCAAGSCTGPIPITDYPKPHECGTEDCLAHASGDAGEDGIYPCATVVGDLCGKP